ncbi:YhbY family RNA-binding protein [Agaribacterium haliotis]|uniref:YhbY family RNA-binding protein n=1 Tax=Agaribacterium haliotis TaxID=2013869 RepID=UPI000BB57B3B|nr:YhbY family RNA-binding protein [Agaribacterium haliotis]
MPLSRDTIKRYRNIGHDLKPVVTISENGLSEGLLAELDRALNDHELIKIKLAIGDRDARKSICAEACEHAKAEIVQEIGKVALIFRESAKPKLKTSNIR